MTGLHLLRTPLAAIEVWQLPRSNELHRCLQRLDNWSDPWNSYDEIHLHQGPLKRNHRYTLDWNWSPCWFYGFTSPIIFFLDWATLPGFSIAIHASPRFSTNSAKWWANQRAATLALPNWKRLLVDFLKAQAPQRFPTKKLRNVGMSLPWWHVARGVWHRFCWHQTGKLVNFPSLRPGGFWYFLLLLLSSYDMNSNYYS